MTDLAALVVRLEVQNAKYVDALDQAQKKLTKFADDTSSSLDRIAEKVVGFLAVDKLVEFASKTIEALANLDHLSQETGVTVENLSKLQFAFSQGGVDADGFSNILKKLGQNITEATGDPTSKAAIAFKSMGVSLTGVGGSALSVDQILGEIANKFAGYADGANKNTIAIDLLGKAGQRAIPTLNGGADALAALGHQAEEAGIVISEKTAKAAEEFSTKISTLKAVLIDGLGARIAADLLPSLNALGQSFADANKSGDSLNVMAAAIADSLRFVTEVILGAVEGVTGLGKTIGAIAAATVDAAKGNFSEAFQIIKDREAEHAADEAAYQAKITALWQKGGADQVKTAQETAAATAAAQAGGAGLQQAPNIDAAVKAEEGLKKLQDYTAGLKVQSDAFNQGALAATKYKLAFGPLAQALADASKGTTQTAQAAKSAAASALSYAQSLDVKSIEKYRDSLVEQVAAFQQSDAATLNYQLHTGELGAKLDALGKKGNELRASILGVGAAFTGQKDQVAFQNIDIQILTLTGHLTEAADEAFKLQNATLLKNAQDTGDTALVKRIDDMHNLTLAQAEYNKQQIASEAIQTDLDGKLALIQQQQAAGSITELDALQKSSAARASEIDQLQAIADKQAEIGKSSGIKSLQIDAAKSSQAVQELRSQTDLLSKKISTDLQDSFSSTFSDFLTGAATASQFFHNFIASIEKDVADLVSKDLAKQIFGGIAGGDSGGGTGWFGAIAGLFQGKAAGGEVTGGSPYLVGEKGPELFVPGASGQIVTNAALKNARGGDTNNFNFMIPADNGYVSRATQQQIAAKAGRAVAQASRRNN